MKEDEHTAARGGRQVNESFNVPQAPPPSKKEIHPLKKKIF